MTWDPMCENSRILYCALEEDESNINRSEAHQTNDLKKPSQKKWPEQNWGIAVGLRVARIPFDTKDNTVTNFIFTLKTWSSLRAVGPMGRRLGQVRDRWLCLGVLCLKSQIPSTKLQTNLKFQYSMTKTIQDEILFGFSNFGHWKLFDICNLIFVISII
jgi:hypothetical protein